MDLQMRHPTLAGMASLSAARPEQPHWNTYAANGLFLGHALHTVVPSAIERLYECISSVWCTSMCQTCVCFTPGHGCTQMGPSGSGKTTLLDVLAGRKTSGRTEGSVLFAGVKASSMFLRRFTGYVEQFGAAPAILRGFPGRILGVYLGCEAVQC